MDWSSFKFHRQAPARDVVERDAGHLAAPALQHERLVLDAAQASFEMHLPVDRVADHDLRDPAGEPFVVAPIAEGPIETRGRHLQGVRLIYGILDVEQRAQVVADPLTILDANAVLRLFDDHATLLVDPRGTVDDDPQHPAARLAAKLHVKNLELMRPRHARRRIAHLLQSIFSAHSHSGPTRGRRPNEGVPGLPAWKPPAPDRGGETALKLKKWARAHSGHLPLTSDLLGYHAVTGAATGRATRA